MCSSDLVLDGEDLAQNIQNMITTLITRAVQGQLGEDGHMDQERWEEAMRPFRGIFLRPDELHLDDGELAETGADELIEMANERARDIYALREQDFTPEVTRELERVIMLRVVDEYWMDHIDAMQELRQGIGLRAYGQSDPVVEYKREGFEMFEGMIAAIQEETVRRLFLVRLKPNAQVQRERVAKVTGESGGGDGSLQKQPVKKSGKIGRNDPCPCGSGLKWKKCTCAEYHSDSQGQ